MPTWLTAEQVNWALGHLTPIERETVVLSRLYEFSRTLSETHGFKHRLHVVAEMSKRLVGAESAVGQAVAYQAEIGAHCDVLVTDGFRYRLYAANRNYEPVAYANLVRLKRSALDLFNRVKRP